MKAKLRFIILIPLLFGFMHVIAQSGGPVINVNPAFLDFDSTLVSQTSTMEIVVKNSGSGILTIKHIISNNPVFAATPDSFSLMTNQEQVVVVTFTPDTQNSFSGQLSIDNTSSTSLVEVLCTGIGRWPLGIDQGTASEKVCSLTPNPVKENLFLSLNLQADAVISIDLIELTGKRRELIKSERITEGMKQLDLTNYIQGLQKGIYILDIRIGKARFSQKMVKI